jgi:hypothetical protein
MSRLPVRLALLVVILAAFVLRAWRLDFQELRGDEAFGYFFSLRPYSEIVEATFSLKEPHPVASYFVQKAWMAGGGEHEFALRFASLWWGVLAVGLLARLGRRFGLPALISILAAALMAVSPYALWHSQDARMYSMSLALTVAAAWLLLAWLDHPRWRCGLAYVAVAWLALHTHYFNAFVLVAQNLFVLSQLLFKRRWWPALVLWAALQILLALLYLPWLLAARGLISSYGGNGDSPDFLAMLERALSVFAMGESTPVEQRMWWAAFALLLMVVGLTKLALNSVNGRRAAWFLALYLALPLLAIWLSAQQRPIFNERYLVTVSPAFFLLSAAIVLDVWRPHGGNRQSLDLPISLISTVLLFVLFIGMMRSLQRHYTDPHYSKTRGWRELAAAITRFSAQFPPAQVRIAQNFPDPTLWYYERGPVEHLVLPPAPQDIDGAANAVAQLAEAGVQRVILPIQPAANWDEQNIAATALAEQYRLAATQRVGAWPVEIYHLPPAVLATLSVDFENGVRLTGFAIQPRQLAAGDYLVVYLDWQGEAAQLSGTEKVFVQLLNEAGQLVAQDDRPFTLTSPAIYAILLPEALPAGDYQLITGLYDPALAGMPRIRTVTGEDRVLVGESFQSHIDLPSMSHSIIEYLRHILAETDYIQRASVWVWFMNSS